MGTTLTGKKVQNTYDSLLKLSDNDNLTSTAKIVGDGLGNNSPIYLSTSKVGINVTPTFEFQTNSHAKIGGDLTVGGNFTVNGTTTIVDSTVIAIGDNMMEMAKDNSSNTMDIGWYGTINSSGEKYVGVFYDASSGVATPEFHIGLGTVEPSSTAAWTVKGKLVIGALDATTGVFSGQVTIPATPVSSTDAASKGYVDAQITAQDLDIAGDSGTGAVDLDSQTFTIAGGTNVTTSVSGQTVTINSSGGIDGSGTANDVVMWQDSDTLTDAPIAISGNNATFAGSVTVNALELDYNTSYYNQDKTISAYSASNYVYLNGTGGTDGLGLRLNSEGAATNMIGLENSNNSIIFYTDSGLTLTLNSDHSATFAGNVVISGGDGLKINTTSDLQTSSEKFSLNGLGVIRNSSDSAATLYIQNHSTTTSTIQPYIFLADSGGNRGGFGVETSTAKVTLNGQGGIRFTTGSSGVGGTEAIFIDTSQNVGIGTTSPTNILHVHQSDASSNSYIHITHADGGSAATDGISIGLESDGVNAAIRNRENGYLRMFTNNTERMRITSAGYVGIGTTSPSSFNSRGRNLVVAGSGNVGISIDSASTGSGTILFADGTGGTAGYRGIIEYDHSTDSMEFSTAATERMRIDSSGNVNIGTTAAATGSHKLVVESASTTGTVNSHIALIGDSATIGQGPQILFSEAGDGQAYAGGTIGFTRTGGNSQGDLLFGTRGSSGDATTTTTERMRIDSSGDLTMQGGRIYVKESDLGNTAIALTRDADEGYVQLFSSGTQTIEIRGNGNSYFNSGNIGIGTTSPTSPLMIAGSGADSAPMLRLEGTGGTQTFNWISSVVYPNMAAGKSVIKLFGQAQSTNNQAWMGFKYAGSGSTSNQLNFGFYANNFLFNIEATGNVGIGTTSPSVLVDARLSGTTGKVAEFHNSVGYGIGFTVESDGGVNTINSESNQALAFATNGASNERMRIDSLGNLSLATATSLDFNVADFAQIKFKESGAITIDSDNNQSSRNFQFKDGDGTSLMFIGDDGNVGIGTTSPDEKLDITGGYLKFNGGDYGLKGSASLSYNATSDHYFQSGGSTKVTFKADGKVGIGTTSPAAPLVVKAAQGGMFRIEDSAGNIGAYTEFSGGYAYQYYYEIGGGVKIALQTNGASYFNGGNVGIGTTSPGTKLSLEDSTTNGAVQISFKNDAREWRTGVHGGINDSFTLYDNTASATRLVVDSSGNVGIATTSPSQLLHCNGNALIHKLGVNAFNASFDFYNNGTTYLNGATTIDADLTISEANGEINFSSGNGYVQTTTGSTSLVLGTNSTEVLRCHSTGKVGINVTSPTEKLDVVDDGGNTNIRVYDSSGNSEVGLKLQNDAKTWTLQNWGSGGDNLRILNNAGNTIQLWDDNGNVGINNTSTSYKLDVTGQIRATDDIIAFSDIRVKENVKTLENSLNKVNKLRGVEFNKIGNNNKSIGVIAQEIEKILPEVVHTDNEGMKSVAYGNITGLLIEAVKELSKEVQELKKQIK